MSEDNLDVEVAAFIDTALWTWDGGCPVEEVVVRWGELDGAEVLLLEVGYLAVYAFEGGLMRGGSEMEMDGEGLVDVLL